MAVSYGSGTLKRRKAIRANSLVRKAAILLRGKAGRYSTAPLASRGFQGYRYGGGTRGELKYVDNLDNDELIVHTGTVVPINLLASGTAVNERVGRKVVLKSCLVNFTVKNVIGVNTNALQGAIVKVSLIYDSQPNGAIAPAAYNDIYSTAHPTSPLNLNNRDRFKVLWSKYAQIGSYLISGAGSLATGAPQHAIRTCFKKMNLPVIFGGAGGSIGDIQTGALLLCFTADVANMSMCDYYTRVRYSDN